MSRHVITLRSEIDRSKVMGWLRGAAYGFRIEVKEPKRSDIQNDRMWAMLNVISKHGAINGKRFLPEAWKCIFMQAMGKESKFLPTLDGESFFPSGFKSSDLTVREMCDLQTFMEVWAAENGIDLQAPADRKTA